MITIAEARQELYNAFAKNDAGAPKSWINDLVAQIFDTEPEGSALAKPASITILASGGDPETLSINFEIRIYVDASNGAKEADRRLDNIIDRIYFGNTETGFNLSYIPAEYSDEGWEKNYEEILQAWAAIIRVKRAREDY